VERVKGPADLLESGDCTLSFMGEEYELEAEDGWFYPQGGSPRFWVVTDGCIDPGTTVKTYLISCTPNGTIEKIEQPDLFQFANLFYSGTLQFGSKIMQLNINLKGYEAWRAAARENEEVPRTEEEQPGFLITAEVDDVGGADPLEAKIVAAKLADTDTGGLTRWLRFSDPTKVALTRDGIPVEIPAPPEELQIDLPATADATYEISMLDPEAWAADTSVTVEYVIKDREGREFPGADKVRLLRPVIIAIGDSLTYGYMGYTNRHDLTPRWSKPWYSYPASALWAEIREDDLLKAGLPFPAVQTNIVNQGWRGYLREQLPGFLWAGETANNTGHWSKDGHGPKHVGYAGAALEHINSMLNDPSSTISQTLCVQPCYAVITYFIGMNNANKVEKINDAYVLNMRQQWVYGLTKLTQYRAGGMNPGKTLVIGITLPKVGAHYNESATVAKINNECITKYNDDPVQTIWYRRYYKDRLPWLRSFKYAYADIESIEHDQRDDGLHFLPPGYEEIMNHIQQAIISGLGGD
ncbi:MAG: hypothetical protein GXY44_06300, partial [Phycisphaerales bacterium]|nr:hypothetical protein [Phycisphaerales bacterium]